MAEEQKLTTQVINWIFVGFWQREMMNKLACQSASIQKHNNIDLRKQRQMETNVDSMV